ncbi:MAG: DUF1697 domain-containing protein [Saprospiraceae bacterium]|nr:DUF1697 domain-containing protein [Saprospiraceae bacterium]
MNTSIAMLRGINVSGQKKVVMTELKKLFEELGFLNVATYIQSGNVVFNSESTENELVATLEKAIEARFGFFVPVMVRSGEDMKKIAASHPFDGAAEDRIHVTFLEKEPEAERVEALSPDAFLPDAWVLKSREVYLHIPVSYGNTKLSNNFLEIKLKVKATTRNWKTVQVLAGMANAE